MIRLMVALGDGAHRRTKSGRLCSKDISTDRTPGQRSQPQSNEMQFTASTQYLCPYHVCSLSNRSLSKLTVPTPFRSALVSSYRCQLRISHRSHGAGLLRASQFHSTAILATKHELRAKGELIVLLFLEIAVLDCLFFRVYDLQLISC